MWTANLFQVTTGAIGPQVRFRNVSWSLSLNEPESLSLEISKTDIPLVDRELWLAPWWAGILYRWNGAPIFAGPIVSIPSESFDSAKLECKGIRGLLDRRLVVEEQSLDWSQLAYSRINLSGYSYGTVAQLVVQIAQKKPGGSLPIRFPIPPTDASFDPTHAMKFDGYNLSDLSCNDVLSKLSGLLNGPDIMFKPVVEDGSRVYWDMIYGDEWSPTIPQSFTPVWDSTAVQGEVVDIDMTNTGSYQSNRVYVTGKGENTATPIKVAQDPSALVKGFPLLESVQNYSDIASGTLLQNNAQAVLEANKKSLVEVQATVRADGEHKLGTFWPGWSAHLIIKGWLTLPDGMHVMRILNISGSDTDSVRMSLQTKR